ncbi:glutamyl-tRNA synthetase [Povalibacter uvarum]|uniref:Glutamate--tRNA ligase n=1 Tax=Povalibacter uvarum TaxID=732238 RepID=A0A841HH53_9GAMM|nr:glutamate--tRNA ligase [Povalibacter uvarum]MBB6091618.1 glutamyl-tRNA synthetase [Povalibacter uvarum]
MTIRTRFAPSPTGMLHIGGVRTALFSWLYAKGRQGDFILRVEDTDRERSTDEATQVILDGMEWLGLAADEGPFYQTRRMDRYREVLAQFVRDGHAYHCYCTKEELAEMRSKQEAAKQKPRYDGTCRNRTQPREGVDPVIRFKNPLDGSVVVEDVIHGNVEFQNTELDDLIIARSDGTPTYNFCVVVDDMDMKITHVIRGDDHLNNTPRQINMLKALGAVLPVYGHVPMILGADGAKLSKRHGAVSVLQYREEGFLPVALLNYLVRLGWSHGDQEVFSLEEMQALFDIKDVNKSASAFNPDKLLWLNQQHIMRATPESLVPHLKFQLAALGIDVIDDAKLAAVAKAQQERAKTLKEMAQNSTFFFVEIKTYDEKAAKKNLTAESAPVLRSVHAKLSALSAWTAAAIHDAVNEVATTSSIGLGKVAQPIRVAVSGTSVSPPIDVTLEVLGRETTLSRIDRAIAVAGAA